MPPSAQAILDDFDPGPLPYWGRFAIGRAQIEGAPGIIRFALEGASSEMLADAEIGDYHGPRRDRLPWRPPLIMEVRARFSHPGDKLWGTAGFGLWNKPFEEGMLAAPPRCLWFFFASSPSRMSLDPKLPGQGWKAAALRSSAVPEWLLALGNLALSLPLIKAAAYPLARGVVASQEHYLDPSSLLDWHDYQIEWRPLSAIFRIDGREVYRAAKPPCEPLGFVAWMDNQHGAFNPSGELAFGRLAIAQRQWLELDRVRIQPIPK